MEKHPFKYWARWTSMSSLDWLARINTSSHSLVWMTSAFPRKAARRSKSSYSHVNMTPKPSKTFCIYHVIYLPKDLYVDMVKQATGSPCSTPPRTGVPQDAPGAKQFGGAQKGTMSESMALLLHQTWKLSGSTDNLHMKSFQCSGI